MKKILFPFLLLLIVNNLNAQSRHFNKLYCDTIHRNIRPHEIDFESTSDDYIYIAEGKPDPINPDAQITKFDKNFNVVWKRTYGGSEADWFNHIKEISNHRLLVWRAVLFFTYK